jgi:hypothetical protein
LRNQAIIIPTTTTSSTIPRMMMSSINPIAITFSLTVGLFAIDPEDQHEQRYRYDGQQQNTHKGLVDVGHNLSWFPPTRTKRPSDMSVASQGPDHSPLHPHIIAASLRGWVAQGTGVSAPYHDIDGGFLVRALLAYGDVPIVAEEGELCNRRNDWQANNKAAALFARASRLSPDARCPLRGRRQRYS